MPRRAFVVRGMLAASTVGGATARARPVFRPGKLAELEGRYGGRLGVCILDTATGQRTAYRADERFALCSTFKVLAAAQVLRRVERGEDSLQRRVVYTNAQVVPYSPETEKHAGGDGMTLGAICEAGLTLSDNTAGNLMLDSIGGPTELTRFARSLGDGVTRLDRMETALNQATPGDPRDTTTPAAMARLLKAIVLEDVLLPDSRAQMVGWMTANRTGGKRLRAGLPAGWRVADKTGGGDYAATNDVAVIWPPERAPVVVAVYFAESPGSAEARDAAVADVGRLVAG